MKENKRLFYVICDNIRSLENIGSIFRTADALGIDKIFLCGISGRPPIGEKQSTFLERKSARPSTQNLSALVSKTALGAEKTIPFEHYWQTWRAVEKLRKEKFQIVALEQDKKSILYTKFKPKFPLALIVGNEVKGVSKKILNKSDKIIYLPMQGKKESLNVSVAFGIAGYEINKFR
jgi:tRNA G18 (ribose-2'-O)-methylase SpoU